MAMTGNLRPGVYSRYDVSSFYTAASSRQDGALALACAAGEPGQVYRLGSYAAAAQLLAGDAAALAAVELLLRSGVAGVQFAPVRDGNYAPALEAVAALDNIGAVICDCVSPEDMALLRDSVVQASEALRERVAFVGAADADSALAAAEALNCERVVVVTPAALPSGYAGEKSGLFAALAVAGTVLAADDAAHNYNGEPLRLLEEAGRLPEDKVQALLAGGVTVLEPVGGVMQIVRLLTTKTKTGGVADRSLSGLNAVLIIDKIIGDLRTALAVRLGGGRLSTRSLDTVLTQVTVELVRQRDNGLIEGFEAPLVYPDSGDPAICVVELSFKIAHVVSQIHVVAHVQV